MMCCTRISYPSSPPRTESDISHVLLSTVAKAFGGARPALHPSLSPQQVAWGVKCLRSGIASVVSQRGVVMEGRLREPNIGLDLMTPQPELMQ